MTIYQDIRGALQKRASLAQGFPPSGQRDYEGITFRPTIGTTYARMTLIPSSARPPFMDGRVVQHEGLFQVDLFAPGGGSPGSATVEQVADAVRAQFEAGLRLPVNAGKLLIRYAERSGILTQPDWLQISVTIAYRIYSNPV
jgi:hypothetical protein